MIGNTDIGSASFLRPIKFVYVYGYNPKPFKLQCLVVVF